MVNNAFLCTDNVFHKHSFKNYLKFSCFFLEIEVTLTWLTLIVPFFGKSHPPTLSQNLKGVMPSLMVDDCLLRTHTFAAFLACRLCHSLYMLLFNVDRYKISLCFKVPVAKCALKFFRKVTSASMYTIGQQMFPCKNLLALLTFVITNRAFFSSTMLGDHVISYTALLSLCQLCCS